MDLMNGSALINAPFITFNSNNITFDIGHNPTAAADMSVTSNLANGGLIKVGAGTLQLSNGSSTFAAEPSPSSGEGIARST